MAHNGERLRAWRDAQEPWVSQQALAEKLGVFQTTISHYERGSLLPGLQEAFAIEALTGIPARSWLQPDPHADSDADDAPCTQPGADVQVGT